MRSPMCAPRMRRCCRRPPNEAGVRGWLDQEPVLVVAQLAAHILVGAFLAWFVWDIGQVGARSTRYGPAPIAKPAPVARALGACWPFVWAKFPQWIYGFYPIDQRWRVNIVLPDRRRRARSRCSFPRSPYKKWNALFLLIALSADHIHSADRRQFALSSAGPPRSADFAAASPAVLVPWRPSESRTGMQRNRLGLILRSRGTLVLACSCFMIDTPRRLRSASRWVDGSAISFAVLALLRLRIASCQGSIRATPQSRARSALTWLGRHRRADSRLPWFCLSVDFGLVPVETSQWGGLW